MKRDWIQTAIMVVALATVGNVKAASEPAFSFSNATVSYYSSSGQASWGYNFTTTTNIFVTHLGYYDYTNGGLRADHDVGIYTFPNGAGGVWLGTLVVSNRVLTTDPVLGDAPNGYYNYHLLESPVELFAGSNYLITALLSPGPASPTNGEQWTPYTAFTGFVTNSLLTVGQSWYVESSVLAYPYKLDPGALLATPNFLFTTTAVPEPSSLVLLSVAVGGLLALRRYRKD